MWLEEDMLFRPVKVLSDNKVKSGRNREIEMAESGWSPAKSIDF
jgi:hypothetical protein